MALVSGANIFVGPGGFSIENRQSAKDLLAKVTKDKPPAERITILRNAIDAALDVAEDDNPGEGPREVLDRVESRLKKFNFHKIANGDPADFRILLRKAIDGEARRTAEEDAAEKQIELLATVLGV